MTPSASTRAQLKCLHVVKQKQGAVVEFVFHLTENQNAGWECFLLFIVNFLLGIFTIIVLENALFKKALGMIELIMSAVFISYIQYKRE